ncbi:helix-turn-helix transcriptional regulator [Acetobacteraceae bacterium]|nr:helix-turn-helix transcriptional regulator [Acetobacteraceae bacterium]
MDKNKIIEALNALAQESRLDAFRLLSHYEPEGISAGEIARTLEIPQNTMSVHLKILQQAGLIHSNRQGRLIIYRADMEYFFRIINFMRKECCGGEPEKCTPSLNKRK